MPITEIPEFMREDYVENNSINIKDNSLYINVNEKIHKVSILDATVIVNSITLQLAKLGIGNVSKTGNSKDKTDISSKKIGSTGGD